MSTPNPGMAPAGWQVPNPTAAADQRPASFGTGIAFGLGAAIVGGVLWYLIVAFTKRQFVYGAILLGGFIGVAVVTGARRKGVGAAVTAGVIALVTVVVAYFYITRHLIIEELKGSDNRLNVGLLPGWTDFWEITKISYKVEKSQYLFTAVATIAAAALGLTRDPARTKAIRPPRNRPNPS